MINVGDLVRSQFDVPAQTSMRGLAALVGMTRDISLNAAVTALQQPFTAHAEVLTPGLVALGGTVDVVIERDGRYTFDVHMHDSGWDPYDFTVRAAVTSPSGLTVMFQCSGHTDGTGSDVFGSPKRNFDHHEQAVHPLVATHWLDVRAGTLEVSKTYEDSGLLGAAEDVLNAVLGFLVADITLGAGLALVIACSAELSDALDANIAGPGGLVGVLVAGGIAWVWGPAAILASVAGGVAAGAITDALVDHRELTPDEYAFAQVVFGDTLPPRERIYVTNLSRSPGRAYTWPNVDHSILLNIDQAYADPVHYTKSNYPVPGQLFIHEMTHAWQIRTEDFVPGLVCERLSKTTSYMPDLSKAWGELGMEQQAAAIDRWFLACSGGATTVADLTTALSSPGAVSHPFFRYVADNLRRGVG